MRAHEMIYSYLIPVQASALHVGSAHSALVQCFGRLESNYAMNGFKSRTPFATSHVYFRFKEAQVLLDHAAH